METEHFFGWAVLDKNDVESNVISAKTYYYASLQVNEQEILENEKEILEQANFYNAGVAPHRIVRLYYRS